MSPWKVILATVIIFAAGVITGGVLVHKVQRPERQQQRPPLFPRPQAGPPQEAMPTPWFARREFLDRMDHQLNLSREQYDRIAKILQDSQERTRRIVRRVNPEIQEELGHVRRQIRAELTPDQTKRFEELQHELRGRPRPPGDMETRRPPPRREPPPMNARPETNTP